MQGSHLPDWVVYPGERWDTITPREAGLDVAAFQSWISEQSPAFGQGYAGDHPASGGVVITRGGCLLHAWGDPEFKHQSSSLAKSFTRMVLQLAVDRGLIGSADDLVKDYWTGEGQLSHPHKYLNRGHHNTLTFKHLRDMRGGFPVTDAYIWRTRSDRYPGVPAWAHWTGDPIYDNYAHVAPGTYYHYSSGGYWRLTQVLTAVWDADLKQVLDEHIMGVIGIPADRWDLLASEYVRDAVDLYPDLPEYGAYLDPPLVINGHRLRGGAGWAVMSAVDFARVGLLMATGGMWRGERLISSLDNHAVGVGVHRVQGWGIVEGKEGYFSWGQVATKMDPPADEQLAAWTVGPVGG